ncbi:undecaprenyl diphosphate synthase family protein [candidate division KSB1 bacterium]|nr:undecaprenyl diphosphate synthase family protein [candidate division KSB1 bacterium]
MRLPNHVGIIPDGNRRWAESRGMSKEQGYQLGLAPGLELLRLCRQVGIKEVSAYGFTTDNTKRSAEQRIAFAEACVSAVEIISREDSELLVVGNTESPMFPRALLPFTQRTTFGAGGLKVNFLVNYGWEWDLNLLKSADPAQKNIVNHIRSSDVSRLDLVIRWGGRRRLSGFLPVQAVYADFYVIDDYWPDFKPDHLFEALEWYQEQDVTLGG